MPVAMKSYEGNEYLDTFIRQNTGKDPLVPVSRTGDSPVQWIQLLNALDQPDFPGLPLFTPVKIQMYKCEKCSREFCSQLNYKRHIRVHRRSLNLNKESHNRRDILASFWDKLSLEEAAEIVSLDDVMLKDISGSSIVKALASSLCKPGMWSLPQDYVKAGSLLSDIIHVKPFRVLIRSEKLFSILDDASEGTFLCAGMAESMQKYLFDGAANNNLEQKNIIACTSFLFEQQLVKAWIAEKDAEALRCHKLLVEEEEAAQKRQAELLKRKKRKKLRQKEQTVKEQSSEENECLDAAFNASGGTIIAEASGRLFPSDFNSAFPGIPNFFNPFPDSIYCRIEEPENDIEAQCDVSSGHILHSHFHVIDDTMPVENDRQHLAINNWQVPKSHKPDHNSVHPETNVQMLRHEQMQKLGLSKDQNSVDGTKVLSKKVEVNSDKEILKPELQRVVPLREETKGKEVMIGSISVTLEIDHSCGLESLSDKAQENSLSNKDSVLGNTVPEKLTEAEGVQSQFEKGNEESDGSAMLLKTQDRSISPKRCMYSQCTGEDNDCDTGKHSNSHLLSVKTYAEENLAFSSKMVKQFLSQRWKKAISADHVKLSLSPGADDQVNHSMASQSSDL